MAASIAMHKNIYNVMVIGLLVIAWTGCGSDTSGPSTITDSQLLWALQVNYPALNLSTQVPYDTAQLQTTPLNAIGNPLANLGLLTYSTPDSAISVSAAGLVTAHSATNGVFAHVIVRLTAEGETLVDTISVTVDTVHHPLQIFSIQPRSDGIDSAKIAVDVPFRLNHFNHTIPIYIADLQNDTLCDASNVCGLAVKWTSSDSTVASIDSGGYVTPLRVGRVVFMATSFTYGRLWQNSLPFTIGYPILANGNIVNVLPGNSTTTQHQKYTFWPPILTIGVGGAVEIDNYSTTLPNDVIFDDSTAVVGWFGGPSGNIPADTTDPRRRVFPTAGTYRYHSNILGASGTIVVSSGP